MAVIKSNRGKVPVKSTLPVKSKSKLSKAKKDIESTSFDNISKTTILEEVDKSTKKKINKNINYFIARSYLSNNKFKYKNYRDSQKKILQ